MSRSKQAKAFSKPLTLSIDVGGTGLKASVLDARGKLTAKPLRVATPYPCPPPVLVKALLRLVEPLPTFDRVSIGFPGVVREGKVITAPHFKEHKTWRGYPLAQTLGKQWRRPVRLLNDADMQGFAVIAGKGLELVVTLGTGVGTALFRHGELMPRMELAQHPSPSGKIYNDYIGDKVLKRIGKKAWNKKVRVALDTLRTLLNYDRLYIGGGNSRHVAFKLDKNMKLVFNEAGVLGGIALWKSRNFKG